MATGVNASKMASAIFRSRAVIFENLVEIYRPHTLEKWNKLTEAAKAAADKAGLSEIVRKAKIFREYYKLEMSPPTSQNELQKIKEDLALTIDFFKSGSARHLTVRQAWLLLVVSYEISLWFYLGETCGKMHIVGYLV